MSSYADLALPTVVSEVDQGIRQFDKDLLVGLGLWNLALKAILDRGIALRENMDLDVVSFTSNAVANTEDTVAHKLGKVPTLFVIGSRDKAGVVYKSGTAFTSTNVYLKTSVASMAVTVILF